MLDQLSDRCVGEDAGFKCYAISQELCLGVTTSDEDRVARLALDELRGVLGILGRSGEAERSPQPTLADLAALVERSRRSGQDVHLEGDTATPVPAAAGYAAYRVVQEALNNVAKHAQASRVSVVLRRSRSTLVVSIEDDGVGFDLSGPVQIGGRQRGYGLTVMRERAQALGGTFAVETTRGGGCTILVRVPLSRPG